MYFPRNGTSRSTSRRGAVLLIVILIMAIFAVVGLSFVLMSESEATQARIWREAQNMTEDFPDPERLFNRTLGNIIYDVPDDTGYYNALRGHSLARSMYGWYYNYERGSNNLNLSKQDSFNNAPNGIVQNDIPFNGLGVQRGPDLPPGIRDGAGLLPLLFRDDDYFMINYTIRRDHDSLAPGDRWVRDPERVSRNANFLRRSRSIVETSQPGRMRDGGDDSREFPFVGQNAPYTYPDRNNVYLAAVRPSDGAVLKPSYVLPYVIDPIGTSPATPNLYRQTYNNPFYRYFTLRPHGSDHPDFPQAPAGHYDVTNLVGGPSSNRGDSIWMDADLPTFSWRGKTIKPLVAVLITDLDNKINLNTAGNKVYAPAATDVAHGSNQGWGPWEVNPKRLLNSPLSDVEFRQKFIGAAGVSGNYGRGPGSNPVAPVGYGNTSTANATAPAPFYSRVDMDGSRNTIFPNDPPGVQMRGPVPDATVNRWRMPQYPPPSGVPTPPGGMAGTQWLDPFPFFKEYYGNGLDASGERVNHPLLFNAYQLNPNSGNHAFPVSDVRKLLYRINEDAAARSSSEIRTLLTTNVSSPTVGSPQDVNSRRVRWQVTPLSFDLDQVGISPWIQDYRDQTRDPATEVTYRLNNTLGYPRSEDRGTSNPLQRIVSPPLPGSGTTGMWTGPGIPYRDGGGTGPLQFSSTPHGSDFVRPAITRTTAPFNVSAGSTRWSSQVGSFAGVDLSRPLPPYPAPTLPTPGPTAHIIDWDAPYPPEPSRTNFQQMQLANQARQIFAADIFNALLRAASTEFTATWPPFNTPEYDACRFLAQTAVNLVDYIDSDDVMTSWVWNANRPGPQQERIYGTELPRLVINEAYIQVGNTKAVEDLMPPAAMVQMSDFQMNAWVELLNPFREDMTPRPAPWPANTPWLSEGGKARLQAEATTTSGGNPVPTYAVYKVVVAKDSPAVRTELQKPNNVKGDVKLAANVGTAIPAEQNPDPDGTDTETEFLVNSFEQPEHDMGFMPAVPDWQVVKPVNGRTDDVAANNGRNEGFYVLGGGRDFPSTAGGMAPMELPRATLKLRSHASMGSTPARGLQKDLNEMQAINPATTRYTFLLRRLANPYMPPNAPTISSPAFNPTLPVNDYITVDYVEEVALQRAVRYRAGMNVMEEMAPNYRQATDRESFGKREPYAGVYSMNAGVSQWVAQTATPPNQPKNTFFRHNSQMHPPGAGDATLTVPFHWLTHLDRPPINPLEVVYCSTFKPHELTQKFMMESPTTPGVLQQFGHRDAWLRPESRLYRALELLRVRSRVAGMGIGGRVPGKVNINTIWGRWDDPNAAGQPLPISGDPPSGSPTPPLGEVVTPLLSPSQVNPGMDYLVLRALADAAEDTDGTGNVSRRSNHFTRADVDVVMRQLLRSRTPGNAPGVTDRPFHPFSVGEYPLNDRQYRNTIGGASAGFPPGREHGFQSTLLRNDLTAAGAVDPNNRLFDTRNWRGIAAGDPQKHPYMRNELLMKILNNVTTRSNVFAVWVTIGYFEALPTVPVTLSNELFVRTGSGPIRHQFFAVVDRTNLSIDSVQTRLAGGRPFFFEMNTIYRYTTPAVTNNADFLPNGVETFQMSIPATSGNSTGLPASHFLNGSYAGFPWDLGPNNIQGIVPRTPAHRGTLLSIGTAKAERELLEVISVTWPPTGNSDPNNPPRIEFRFVNPDVVANYFNGNPSNTAPLPNTAYEVSPGVPYRSLRAHHKGALVNNLTAFRTVGVPAGAPAGAAIRATGLILLGNPGPQPNFDYRDRRYAPVVPYVERIK